MKGLIDDFKVFPRVLHAEEIACLALLCPVKCLNKLAKCAKSGPHCPSNTCTIVYPACNYEGTT